MKLAPWWTEKVPRALLFAAFLSGALIGFGVFRWGHHWWPNFFSLVGQ